MKSDRGWVSFLFGTCVVVPEPESDLGAAAAKLLAEHGRVVVGTPQGDFGVHAMSDEFGWLVSGAHPDVLVRVSPSEAEGASELVLGLLGREKRGRDAETLVILQARVASDARSK